MTTEKGREWISLNWAINITMIFLLMVVIVIFITDGFKITFFGVHISINHLVNPFILCYFLFYLKVVIDQKWRHQVIHIITRFLARKKSLIILMSIIFFSIILMITMSLLLPESQWWDLDSERGIGTVFSGSCLMLAALLATIYFYQEQESHQSHYWIWLVIALLFHYLALDEIAFIHEKMSSFEKIEISLLDHPALKQLGWLVVYAPLILVAITSLVYFAWTKLRQYKSVMIVFVLALSCYLLSLVSEGLMMSFDWSGQPVYKIQVAIEESLELLGTTFFILCFALYHIQSRLSNHPI